MDTSAAAPAVNPAKRVKLTGRAFYESIGSPKMIVAPMVDRSEFAWRLLTRSYLDEQRSKQLLAYSPMLHARLFQEQAKFRDAHFQPTKESLTSKEKSNAQPYLDGRTDFDRPLFVQFCANKPEEFLEAAQYVAPYCDAVDLNLGCPQGIAKSGHYGAFLQEDWETIRKLIRNLRDNLDVPVTAKFRILETKAKTLEYARMLLDSGASIITVHGRQRHQKGHHTGLADWETIRFLRDNLPSETVLFANGNILNSNDIEPCLKATGADGVMSAEGNLSDPTIFALPPDDLNNREYWRDPYDKTIGGYRIDGVFRRYLDIIHRHVLEQEPPSRVPLYIPDEATSDVDAQVSSSSLDPTSHENQTNAKRPLDATLNEDDPTDRVDEELENSPNTSKKQKKKHHGRKKDMAAVHNPNLKSMQGHLFQLLRPMVNSHTHIRDALARARAGDIQAFENVLSMVETATREGLDEEFAALQAEDRDTGSAGHGEELRAPTKPTYELDTRSSESARERCRRPFWVCQPHVRPLPEEAVQLGAITLSKKEKKEAQAKDVGEQQLSSVNKSQAAVAQRINFEERNGSHPNMTTASEIKRELPQDEALACG